MFGDTSRVSLTAPPAGGMTTAVVASGPLAQLQAISRRISGLQGHISSFLLRQHSAQAAEAGSKGARVAAGICDSGRGRRLVAGAAAEPACAVVQEAGGPTTAMAANTAPRKPGRDEVFSDDFILSMQLGTDFRRLQRVGLEAATAGTAHSTVAGAGNDGRVSPGGSGALQRLKEATTAQRVGRAVRVGSMGRAAA